MSKDNPASETHVLRARRGEKLDPDAAPLSGTRFSKFMQLPSRMDLSDELRHEREGDATRASQPPRTVSGRNLQRSERDNGASFASLAPYAASEDFDDGRALEGEEGPEGEDGAPGRLSVSRTKSQTRLAAQAIAVGTDRAAQRAQGEGAAADGNRDDSADDDWFSSIFKAFKRMC
jgi:hypothetical protein